MLREPLTLISTSFALLGGLTLTACSSGASGSGAFDAPPTTTSGPSVTTDPPSSTDSGSGETGAPGESSSGDEPTTATTTTDPSTTGVAGESPALLQWTLARPIVNYGDIPVDGAASTIIELENVGDHAATSIATGTIPGDFSFPGGYPGTEGTCGTELGAGQTCRLDLRFGPNRIGPVESSFALDYYDGVNLGLPTQTEVLTLRGGGQGESANLLLNGGAETGDTESWEAPLGLASWTTSDVAFGGAFSFTPTGAFGVAVLDQDVALGDSRDETSVEGLRYRIRARARSDNGSHNYRVLINLGADFEEQAGGTETSWTLLEHAEALPAGVSDATVRIECGNGNLGGGPCDVLFDDVTLQLVYP